MSALAEDTKAGQSWTVQHSGVYHGAGAEVVLTKAVQFPKAKHLH